MAQKGTFLDILIDFWAYFWGGVENGIFRTLKCTFGVSGFRGSVAGQGVCNSWARYAIRKKKRGSVHNLKGPCRTKNTTA